MPSKREIDREIQQLKLKHKEVFNETLGLCNRTKEQVQLHLKPVDTIDLFRSIPYRWLNLNSIVFKA